jgi:hypothetical protein
MPFDKLSYDISNSQSPAESNFAGCPIVDEDDTNTAVETIIKTRAEFLDNTNTFDIIRDNINIYPNVFYYFKVMHKHTNNGMLVSLPPYDMSEYQLYFIQNNVLNRKSMIKAKTIKEILVYFYKFVCNTEIHKLKFDLVHAYIKSNISSNFIIERDDKNIIIVENGTNNGYYLVLDNDDNFATIIIMYNNKIYKAYKMTYVANTIFDLKNKMEEYISKNVHNIEIKRQKVKPVVDLYEMMESASSSQNTSFSHDSDPE